MAPTGLRFAHAARVIGIAIALIASTTARADITNGSYETGPPNPSGDMILTTGSTAITGWTVSRGSIEYLTDVGWQCEDGTRSIGLNGTAAGGISQVLATTPGRVYTVSFWMAGEPFTPPTVKNLRVLAAGQSADFSFDSGAAWHWAMGWTQHTWDFTANATSTTLEFMSLDAGEYSPALDNITITTSPVSVDPPVAGALWLAPVHPNPSRGPMTIEFQLPREDRTTIRVLDVSGREVSRPIDRTLAAGRHSVPWDARGVERRTLSSGVYFLELNTGAGRLTRRFTILD